MQTSEFIKLLSQNETALIHSLEQENFELAVEYQKNIAKLLELIKNGELKKDDLIPYKDFLDDFVSRGHKITQALYAKRNEVAALICKTTKGRKMANSYSQIKNNTF